MSSERIINKKYNKLTQARKANTQSKGICFSCYEPLDNKGIFCSKCCIETNANARGVYAQRKENSLCVRCGEIILNHNNIHCENCLDKKRKLYYKKKEKKNERL